MAAEEAAPHTQRYMYYACSYLCLLTTVTCEPSLGCVMQIKSMCVKLGPGYHMYVLMLTA